MITKSTALVSFIIVKLIEGTFFFVTPTTIIEPNNDEIINKSIVTKQQNEDMQGFQEFLEFIKSKGLGIFTFLEAGALYFLWTIIKDTKSREEFLEKVFESWSKDEKQVRSFGKLFRSLGVSCLALHDASLNELLDHLKQKHIVILMDKDFSFYQIKSIEDQKFVLKNEMIYESQITTEIPIKGSKFDILIFFQTLSPSFPESDHQSKM